MVRRKVEDHDREICWDPATGWIDAGELEGVDAVVHLAGENLGSHRWNETFKREIRDSRVLGTRLLAEALAALAKKPGVLCCASAIGFYGDRGNEVLTESSPPGTGFLAEVCQAWEAATTPAGDAGIRVVHLRSGVVLSRAGGALAKMLPPFKLGAGGVIGGGRQYWSWIALDDLVRVIEFVLQRTELAGPVNTVAPHPVTNREFTETLGRVLGRPTILPMPAFAARLALGEMADEMLLASARVEPHVLLRAGFEFQFPQLETALRQALTETSD
jgi:uncharacterized protein (TIGR01777 family)